MKYSECLYGLSSHQIMDHWALFYVGFYYFSLLHRFSLYSLSSWCHIRWAADVSPPGRDHRWWCRSCRSAGRSGHSFRRWCRRSCPRSRPSPWGRRVSPQWPGRRHHIWKYFNWKTIYQHGFLIRIRHCVISLTVDRNVSPMSTDLSSLPGTHRSPVPATTS